MIFIIIKNKSIELLLRPFYHKNGTLDNSIFKVICKNVTIMGKGGKYHNSTPQVILCVGGVVI